MFRSRVINTTMSTDMYTYISILRLGIRSIRNGKSYLVTLFFFFSMAMNTDGHCQVADSPQPNIW